MMQERRIHERFELNLPAEVELRRERRRTVENVRTINIGAGGAYFPIAGHIKPGEELDLRISAPEGNLFRISDAHPAVQDADVKFETRGIVLRSEKRAEFPDHFCLAIKFVGPVKFSRIC